MSAPHTPRGGGSGPTRPAAGRTPGLTGEVLRITASMTGACAIGALILGLVYMGTARYQEAAQLRAERNAVTEMLALDSTATVVEVRQFLAPERREVIYRTAAAPASGGAPARQVVFTLDGQLVAQGPPPAETAAEARTLKPLGRIFVARRGATPAGFVVEEESRGYKNRIRFFVALDAEFNVAGVRVVEHEEDPGLGAEVATPWFQGQFVGRSAERMSATDVTKDPMPEDWRAALASRARLSPAAWRAKHEGLIRREASNPVYAVTGATISSRALTDGVRAAVDHFRRRWSLVAPYLENPS